MNDRKGRAARLNHSANVDFLAQGPTHPIGQKRTVWTSVKQVHIQNLTDIFLRKGRGSSIDHDQVESGFQD